MLSLFFLLQVMVDDSVMEDNLDEENEAVTMKNAFCMDECQNEDGLNLKTSIEDDEESQVGIAFLSVFLPSVVPFSF